MYCYALRKNLLVRYLPNQPLLIPKRLSSLAEAESLPPEHIRIYLVVLLEAVEL
jgi:hypothetical protein